MPFPHLAVGDACPRGRQVVQILREGSATPLYRVTDAGAGTATLMLLPRLSEDEDRQRFRHDAGAVRGTSEVLAFASDFDVEDDVPWLLLEDLEGEDLERRVAREGPLDPQTAQSIVGWVGAGLREVHERWAHGGLRPEMVFLVPQPDLPPRVKVLGLGVAEWTVPRAPLTHSIVVDRMPYARWLSPAQARDASHAATPADDVWALGLLAFFLMAGKPFWKGERTHDVFREILFDPIPPPSVRARELGALATFPPGFDAWFGRCVCPEAFSADAAPNLTAGPPFKDAAEAIRALLPAPPLPEIRGNPKGSFYDAGLREHADQQEDAARERDRATLAPSWEATDADGRTGYRRSVLQPPRDPGVILANPKGSFYDRGLRDPRNWPRLVVVLLAILGGIYLARRC